LIRTILFLVKSPLPISLLLVASVCGGAFAQQKASPPAPAAPAEERTPDKQAPSAKPDALIGFGFDLYRQQSLTETTRELTDFSPRLV